ncbi:G-protein coupled receptor 157-like [Crassostrea virginica]
MTGDIEAQAAITLSSATLSFLRGIALLETYFQISEFQTSMHRLLVFLTIADILTVFGCILGTTNFLLLDLVKRNSTDPICEVQSFITTFSSLASFAWTSIIALHLYLVIRKERNFQRNRIIKVLYHFIGWIIPGVITSDVLGIGKLDRDTHGTRTATGLWCWIKITKSADGVNSDDTFLMLISGKLWEIITYVLSLIVYMMLKFSIT